MFEIMHKLNYYSILSGTNVVYTGWTFNNTTIMPNLESSQFFFDFLRIKHGSLVINNRLAQSYGFYIKPLSPYKNYYSQQACLLKVLSIDFWCFEGLLEAGVLLEAGFLLKYLSFERFSWYYSFLKFF